MTFIGSEPLYASETTIAIDYQANMLRLGTVLDLRPEKRLIEFVEYCWDVHASGA